MCLLLHAYVVCRKVIFWVTSVCKSLCLQGCSSCDHYPWYYWSVTGPHHHIGTHFLPLPSIWVLGTQYHMDLFKLVNLGPLPHHTHSRQLTFNWKAFLLSTIFNFFTKIDWFEMNCEFMPCLNSSTIGSLSRREQVNNSFLFIFAWMCLFFTEACKVISMSRKYQAQILRFYFLSM